MRNMKRHGPVLTTYAVGPDLLDCCFKHGCANAIRTWECRGREVNGLCLDHAERPEQIGTVDHPTPVRVKETS